VVKPPAGHHGAGVAIELTGPEEVAAAFRTASADEGAALVEAYVPGRDHRVHVVDTEVFGCEVASRADDYRYPGRHAVHIRACRLPREVQDRCRALAATMRLPVAGIDLRRTPAGQWYCFEVNPSPAFTYYQEWTGQPIGAAIARLLAAPPGS
jgi:glutathione synthase/RimK-type ligase-like ATP-grasp enzyme